MAAQICNVRIEDVVAQRFLFQGPTGLCSQFMGRVGCMFSSKILENTTHTDTHYTYTQIE